MSAYAPAYVQEPSAFAVAAERSGEALEHCVDEREARGRHHTFLTPAIILPTTSWASP